METSNDFTIIKHIENIELYTLNGWWVWNVNFSINLFTKKYIFRTMGDLEYQVQGLLYNPCPKSQYSVIWFDAENFYPTMESITTAITVSEIQLHCNVKHYFYFYTKNLTL